MTRLFEARPDKWKCRECGCVFYDAQELNAHETKHPTLLSNSPGYVERVKAAISELNEPYKAKASKMRPSLLPAEGVLAGIAAMEFGATKYGANAWRTADMQQVEFMDALERHLMALKQGENVAPDSQVHHLGHIIANAAIMLAKYPSGKGGG